MKVMEESLVDKSEWGPGPWQSEPDKRQWQDETTGLPCLIVRGPVGALCGYVGVPPDHPAYGLAYDGTPAKEHRAYHAALREQMRETVKEKDAAKNHEAMREAIMGLPERPEPVPDVGERIANMDIHGGLTYAAGCKGDICHVPAEGEPDNVWWFGFDCAHAFDLCPEMAANLKKMKHLMPPAPPGLVEAMERADWRDVYRDVAYVTAECASLAKQLAEMANN